MNLRVNGNIEAMTLPVVLSPEALKVFPADYARGREKFLLLSQSCPQLEDALSFTLQKVSTENDQPLATEVIWLGSRSAQKVVVLISATHGVEGFVGAAIQTDILLRLQQDYRLADNTAVIMVFALNPYGFAHCRRCDEMGIDLNRNFIDFDKPLPVNQGYEQIRSALYCEDAGQRQSLLQDYAQHKGKIAFEIAISGGQYTDPQGPFYGGLKPAHGRKVIEHIIQHYRLGQRHLAVIDIHSGRGPYGYGELINDHPIDSSGFQVANAWYGASVSSPVLGDSSSVQKLGLLDYAWHPLMARRGCFITLEFGSYATQALFNVILDDHRSWNSADPRAKAKSAEAMQQHFCPQDNYWRELVLIKGRQVFQQAMDGLQND